MRDIREIEVGPFRVRYFEPLGGKHEERKELSVGHQIQFWTPSARTKETPGVPEWVKIDGEAKLDEFAQLLQ